MYKRQQSVSSTQEAQADASTEAVSSAAEGEPVTLKLFWWGNQVRNDLTQQVIDLYMKDNPNVTIMPEFTDWNGYWDKPVSYTHLYASCDERVVLVALADRLHNMRTIDFVDPATWEERAKMTLEVFGPMAAECGKVKCRMEFDDLAEKYLSKYGPAL